MLLSEFKKVINNFGPDGFIDFMEFYESPDCDKQRLYEVYSCLGLQNIFPGAKIYDLNFPKRIPSNIIKKHNLNHILQGQSTRGGDILVLDTHSSILFDCKTKICEEKSIGRNAVAGKYVAWKALNRTAKKNGSEGIDKFGIISDTLKDLTNNTKKDMPDASILSRDDLLNEKIYRSVVKLCNKETEIKGDPVGYRPNNPWTDTLGTYLKELGKLVDVTNFVELAIQKLKNDVKSYWKKNPDAISLKIINLWPAGAGKTTFWIKVWEQIFFNPTEKNVSNLLVTHNTTVASNNVERLIKHIPSMKPQNQPEVVLVTDKKTIDNGSEELDILFKNHTKVIPFGKDLIKFMRQKRNHQVFYVVLIHNYTKLENVLASEGMEINFTFLDEVHHFIQPIVQDIDTGTIFDNWRAPVENSKGVLKNILGASANKKEIEDLSGKTVKGAKSVDMKVGPNGTWQIMVTHISETMARDFGWKRPAKLMMKPFSADCFKNKDLIEKLGEGKNAKVKLRGFPDAVPVYWVTNADAWLVWKLENPGKKHTLATCNNLKNCRTYAKFLQFYIDNMLMNYVSTMDKINGNSDIVKRIKKLHICVVESDTYDTAKYLREVEAVPGTYEDSLVLHVKLLGEGWSPKDGWVDSTQFIDPAHSKLKIYQFMERGARVTNDALQEDNHIIFSHWDESDNRIYNLFKFVKILCEELDIAVDPISEKEVFDIIGSTIGSGGGTKKKSNTVFYVEDVDVLQDNFKLFYRDGKYIANYDIYAEYINDLKSAYEKNKDDEFLINMVDTPRNYIDMELREEFYKKYKTKFIHKEQCYQHCAKLRKGEFVSSLTSIALDCDETVENAKVNLHKRNYEKLKTLLDEEVAHNHKYIDSYLTREEIGFKKKMFERTGVRMLEEIPVQTTQTKRLNDMTGVRKYDMGGIVKRFGWYGLDGNLLYSDELKEKNKKRLKDFDTILEEDIMTYFLKEPNYFTHFNTIKKEFDLSQVNTVAPTQYFDKLTVLIDEDGNKIKRGLTKKLLEQVPYKENFKKIEKVFLRVLKESKTIKDVEKNLCYEIEKETGFKADSIANGKITYKGLKQVFPNNKEINNAWDKLALNGLRKGIVNRENNREKILTSVDKKRLEYYNNMADILANTEPLENIINNTKGHSDIVRLRSFLKKFAPECQTNIHEGGKLIPDRLCDWKKEIYQEPISKIIKERPNISDEVKKVLR